MNSKATINVTQALSSLYEILLKHYTFFLRTAIAVSIYCKSVFQRQNKLAAIFSVKEGRK